MNVQSKFGQTAILKAAYGHSAEIVQMLHTAKVSFLGILKPQGLIRVKQANKIETFEQKSNPDSAIALLKTMLALLDGSAEPIPPGMAWKCKSCSFRTLCPHLCPA